MSQQDGQPSSNQVLVSGASFAGLATAYWMNRLGFRVTVVEVAPGLKKGGTPVDIRDSTIDIVKRMGLFDRIWSKRLPPKRTEFKDSEGNTVAGMSADKAESEDCEIERDVLLDILFDEARTDVEFLFDERVVSLEESDNHVQATFKSGACRSFALVFGCDGNRSSIRRMQFGPDIQYTQFLKHYFGIAIINGLMIEEDTTEIYNTPGKAAMLNAYNGKTDVVFSFFSESEMPFDYRDQEWQKEFVRQQFAGQGWRTSEMLEELSSASNFYFDQFCQIRMPSWFKGRVALVGDAGYCASPAAGMGGSLAIVGASALGEAFQNCGGNFEEAFRQYDKSVRPFVEEVQRQAVEAGLNMFVPRTEEAILARNSQLAGMSELSMP